MTGSAHEVVSAYESAPPREPSTKGCFLGWEIVEPRGEESHTLRALGPLTVKFKVHLYKAVQKAHHGIALFNHDRQLIWGKATDDLELTAGEHEFHHEFPMLPLRPGPYTWLVSLYDDGHDLVDALDCYPQMIVATDPLTHPGTSGRDCSTFLLNFQS